MLKRRQLTTDMRHHDCILFRRLLHSEKVDNVAVFGTNHVSSPFYCSRQHKMGSLVSGSPLLVQNASRRRFGESVSHLYLAFRRRNNKLRDTLSFQAFAYYRWLEQSFLVNQMPSCCLCKTPVSTMAFKSLEGITRQIEIFGVLKKWQSFFDSPV